MKNEVIKKIISDSLTAEEKIKLIVSKMEEEESVIDYKDSYNELSEVVRDLEGMNGPDVDAIIPLMEKGMKAFKSCEERINNIEKHSKEME